MKSAWACITLLLPSSLFAYELGSATSKLELESINYSDVSPNSNTLHQLSLSANYTFNLGNNGRFVASPTLRESNFDGIKNHKRIDEAFIDWRLSQSDLRIGIQKFSWGRTDIVNPIDFSNANFQDPLDDEFEDMGQLAISQRSYYEHSDLEVLWIPFYTASELPDINSPWFPNLVPTTPLGHNIDYQLLEVNKPKRSINNSQFGIRLTGSKLGMDYGISYFTGWNDLPVYQQSIIPIDSNNVSIELEPITYRINVIGVDGATGLGSYTIRTELAYINTTDDNGSNPLIDDSFYHAVFGIDKQINDVLLGEDLNILLEWSRQYSSTNIQYGPTDLDHIFENTLFVRLSTNQAPAWEAQLDIVYDLANEGQFIRPTFISEVMDDFKVSIMLEWMNGNEDSFFGTFKDNRSIRIRFSKDSFLF